MAMDDRSKRAFAYVGIALSAALIGGAVVWLIMSQSVSAAEDDLAVAEAQIDELSSDVESLTAGLALATQQLAQLTEEPEDSTTSTTNNSNGDEGTTTASTEKQFCFMRSGTWSGGPPMLTVDYAQLLTGDEAADAATARGDESPPPGDFYIVNDNPLLREFPADQNMTVTVTSKDDGVDPDGYSMPFGQWFDVLVGMSGSDFVADRPYWITITDGEITAIEEQYFP